LVVAAPASGVGGGVYFDQLRSGAHVGVAGGTAVKSTKKRIRSCNKGDNRNRKHRTSAAVDAWAVACEFPPRSQPIPSAALQTAAAVAAILGG
jgi:hypothetical protein